MRIALYHNLPSGGAKRTLMESTRRLAAHHHVDAYTLSCAEHEFANIQPWTAKHFVSQFTPGPLFSSPFGRANQVVRSVDLWRLRRLARTIAAEIEGGGYDVAFVHPCQFEQSPSILRYFKRTPAVYYCQEPRRSAHETMPQRPYDDEMSARRRALNRLDPLPLLYRGLARRTDRVNTQSASTVLVNSRFMFDSLMKLYGVKAEVSYHGVDADRFAPRRLEKQHMVLSVGSLTPLKGFDFLVQAMAEIDAIHRPKLVIASNFQNADERAYLDHLARRMGVCLELRGTVSDEELVRLYNEAKLVAYAPVKEPFGLVPLEAMACGTPVVCVREGGVVESVVEGHTGLIVDRDSRQFATAVQCLLADSALARRMGQAGRAHVLADWTWDRAVASIERALEAAAGRSPLSPQVPAFAH